MVVFPNAKINIGLAVTAKRSDGFHEIETIMYPVRVFDALEIVPSSALSFTSSGIEIPGSTSTNLCVKAYHLIKNDFDIPEVHIHLHKNIPVGAGLGGGSSDAAYTLIALNNLFNLSIDNGKLQHYARLLGSDCAFFIENKPVFAYEKGDVFEQIYFHWKFNVVIVYPEIHISTAKAYSGIIPSNKNAGVLRKINFEPEKWKGFIENDFEETIFKKHQQIKTIKDEFYAAGAIYSAMSGSGSAVYGIFDKQVKLPALEKFGKVFYEI